MTDDELRTLVREAIARHLRTPDGAGSGSPGAPRVTATLEALAVRAHLSHGQFVLPVGMDSDGPCIIEPAVACNHCGFCKSYGH